MHKILNQHDVVTEMLSYLPFDRVAETSTTCKTWTQLIKSLIHKEKVNEYELHYSKTLGQSIAKIYPSETDQDYIVNCDVFDTWKLEIIDENHGQLLFVSQGTGNIYEHETYPSPINGESVSLTSEKCTEYSIVAPDIPNRVLEGNFNWRFRITIHSGDKDFILIDTTSKKFHEVEKRDGIFHVWDFELNNKDLLTNDIYEILFEPNILIVPIMTPSGKLWRFTRPGIEIQVRSDSYLPTVEDFLSAWLVESTDFNPDHKPNMSPLSSTFLHLHHLGIVSKQNFSCCQSCGTKAIQDYSKDYSGYAFFHIQDRCSALVNRMLYISYDSFEGNQIGVGRLVAKLLKVYGFEVTWNRSGFQRIRIELDERSLAELQASYDTEMCNDTADTINTMN